MNQHPTRSRRRAGMNVVADTTVGIHQPNYIPGSITSSRPPMRIGSSFWTAWFIQIVASSIGIPLRDEAIVGIESGQG
jgi:hypothetical protein